MDLNTLATFIIVLCGIKSTNLTDYQQVCSDHYNNCMVKYGKEIEIKRLPYCEEQWKRNLKN